MTRSSELSGPAAIEARSVVKQYQLGETISLRTTLRALGLSRFRAGTMPNDTPVIDALSDVTFTVRKGECLGVVGANGSGKSTIVQLIAGITPPTNGSVTVRGRVLPLLSVGSSFHPELTGAENVRLFAAILGIDDSVARASLPQIARFAEVERHMDTPIKRYSDGMQARLSFAISMLFPADLYLFDEVLAVVDGEFLDRCLAAIAGFVEKGRTVLFVSHSTQQLSNLCDRILWLENGKIQALGPASEVLPSYVAQLHESPSRITLPSGEDSGEEIAAE